MTKQEINTALKDKLGFGFVKMQKNDWQEVTHSSKLKGLPGGSIGPMTATTAYRDVNRQVVDKLAAVWYALGAQVKTAGSDDYYALRAIITIAGKEVEYTFSWKLFPTYAHNHYDRGYQNYWLVLNR